MTIRPSLHRFRSFVIAMLAALALLPAAPPQRVQAAAGSGTVVAWGANEDGQTTVPAGLTGVIAIAAGGRHTVALKSDGTLVAWGFNRYGQTTVPAGLTSVIAIAAGGFHTVALQGGTAPIFTGGPPPTGLVGAPYSFSVDVSGFPPPTLSIVGGSLPPGLSLNASTINGTPTQAGLYDVTLQASNSAGTATWTFHFEIDQPPDITGTPPAGTVGTPYSYSFTLSGYPPPYFAEATSDLPPGLSFSGATLNGTPTQAGSFTFSIQVRSQLEFVTRQFTVVIGKAALTATVTPATRQYSDPNPSFTVSFSGFVNGDDASVISGSPNCTTTATPSSPAGQYPITCNLSGMSAANYTIPASAAGTLTVVQENTATDYTGDQFVLTAGPKTTTAPVRLAAQLTQEADGYPGDLSKAQVVFELYKSSNLGNTPDLVVGPVAVSATGVAETAATLAADTWTIKVKVAAGNQYWVANPVGMSTLTVAVGNTARRVTGGGWVADAASANGKGNFGFTVAPDKQGNPKGNAQYIFRGTDGYTYLVKSSSWQGGGLSFFQDPSRARFSGKAVIQQIDPTTGNVVASQGNTSFTVELVDGDALSPRQSDQYGITVRTSGGVLWKQIALTALGGGNVAVKSK